ncbi:SWI/SNF complex subunit SWI3C-like isoform X3 [Gastrolobium bilobum]|uniref:SWI/SNF complex subunit SWI3C-like isoform X3 n=1 Tax=Gastrolobium bilobum TaxID=150636 RepID=UPI002AB161FE|nr:SWI/SNF complex subunit SWI3C-like isoform X3 [Gastrolobium bilobum]
MPPSPSFPSENRTKWRKKRKRESQISKRHQKHLDDDQDEEDNQTNAAEEDREDDSDDQLSANPKPPVEIESLSLDGVQISQFPAVIKRAVNRPHSSVMAIVALERANESGDCKVQLQQNVPVLENVSHGQLQILSSVPADSLALDSEGGGDGSNSSCIVAPPPILEGPGVVKRFGSRVLVVPMHSDWFSPATVHRLERQAVPHFFSGKSPEHTPERYMECRNYIVARYMEDPGKRIAVSNCHRLLVGVGNEDLNQIFRFLDHWGIINYCAEGPSLEHWDSEICLKEETSGAICVPSAALKSLDSLIKFDKPKCKFKANEIYSSLTTHNGNISDLDDRIREHLSENHCNCCSRPLPIIYYQSQKEVDIFLCTDCFHDGRFITGHSSIDFIRVDSTMDYGDQDGDSWTDQETLLLLEAMEIYNDSWNDIAEHVGTKSKAQCILHFLRLPMEDGKLENINVSSMSLSSNVINRDDSGRLHRCLNGDSAGLTDSDDRLPFVNSGNPVMALVAFLASAVGPRVAAACAHAALAALSENNSGSMSQIEALEHDNRTNPESIHSRDGGSHGEIAISNEDKAKMLGSRGQNDGGATPLSAEKVKRAARAGLSAAAMKAKLFADHEEREIQRLCANIVNNQLKRLDLKLRQFTEIDTLLMKECEQVEKVRERFAAERSRVISARLGTGGATPPMNVAGVGPSMVNNNSSNRQQMMPASSSQPSISGYGNSQAVHPHMSFVPRPSMFGLGQRLPFSMIQQSQSVPSNAMFNAPANMQPSPNHPLLRSVSGTNSGLG